MPEKKKVLFLLEAFDKGGIEKVTLDIVNNLDPDKYDITVQTFWYGGHCQSLVAPHVKVIPFFFRRYVRGIIRLIDHLSPRLLYRLFVRGNYDIEIAASDGGAAKVISGSTNPDSLKICWVHMDVVERGSQLREFASKDTARDIYKKFDRIACVSNHALTRFVQKFGSYPDMRSVHNPIPDEEIRNKAKAFPIQKDPVTEFISVGRLAVEKGYDRLILAAAKLQQQGHDFRIRIIGGGGQQLLFDQLIHQYGLEKNVILEGYCTNPYPYIAAADWYICSSLDEAYPLSIGEAFCLGTPVLGTDCTGVREWLEDNHYGIITENSTEGIYNALLTAMQMDDSSYIYWKQQAANKAEQICFTTQLSFWQQSMFGVSDK